MATPQAQVPDLSDFDMKLVNAFQTLSQARMQCAMLHSSVVNCIDKCMDKSDLATNKRSTLPVGKRLQLDNEEKLCLRGCSAKWDDALKRHIVALNRRETNRVQMRAFMQMQDMMERQSKGITP